MKNVLNTSLIISAFAFWSSFSYASSALPDGWRAPTVNETTYYIPIREEGPNRYLFTEADFDGDGKIDVARILVNDKKNKLALFVFLSRQTTSEVILLAEMDDKSRVRLMGVTKLEPGTYQTACGKGYGRCKEDALASVSLEWPTIKFFQLESASSVFVWDEPSQSFAKVWMSD